MKINGNEIRIGNIIQHQGQLWVVVKTDHVKPGKGGAFCQAELKDIRNGTKLNERFRSSETVERVRLDQKEMQYLYSEGGLLTFMDGETYEQISMAEDLLGEKVAYLQEGMKVTIEFHEEEPLSVTLPETVILELVDADPVVKGQTAASSYKPAKASNGMKIMVPPFVAAGERVVVNTETDEYVRRAD